MASSTSSSSSSSPSSVTRLKAEFNEALSPQAIVGSNSSSRINYFDSLGSGDPSVTNDQEYPDLSGDPIEEPDRGNYSYQTIVNVDETNVASSVHDDDLQERRESQQRRVLFIVAFHLILLSAVDFSLQILLVHCGTYCPDTDILHHIEMGIVILFPLTALVFLRLVVCCKSAGTSFILMSLYTVSFALFFYGACDLVFGNTRAHRDIALILFTLTLSFILFSLYVYSKNSTKCFYLALGILIIMAVLALGILLAFPSTFDHLPHKLEGILTKNKESDTTSVLVLYALAFVYALAAVSLTTLMFTVLRGIIFKRDRSALNGGACSTAVEVLLRTEMFFIVWPFEILSRLARRCSWTQG